MPNDPPNANNSLEFFLPVTPLPQGRPRFSVKRGKRLIYEPVESKKLKQRIKMLASYYVREKLGTLCDSMDPCSLRLIFVLNRPISRTSSPFPNTKPDIDNLCKLVLDALSGVLYRNDSAIIALQAFKQYTSNQYPQAGIHVTYKLFFP